AADYCTISTLSRDLQTNEGYAWYRLVVVSGIREEDLPNLPGTSLGHKALLYDERISDLCYTLRHDLYYRMDTNTYWYLGTDVDEASTCGPRVRLLHSCARACLTKLEGFDREFVKNNLEIQTF